MYTSCSVYSQFGLLWFTEDRKNGKTLPIEEGKIFVSIRMSLEEGYDAPPSYDDVELFLHFVDKYVSCNYGKRELSKFYRLNRSKTLFDKLTVFDIAYTILVYENSRDVWDEDLRFKECRTDEQRNAFNRTATQLYHVKKGAKLPTFAEGWTDDGRDYYNELVELAKSMKRDGVFWTELVKHWREYIKRHHKYYYDKIQGESESPILDAEGDADDDGDEDDDECNVDIPELDRNDDELVEDEEEEVRPTSRARVR